VEGSRLDWGLLSAFHDGAAPVPPDLARIWQVAGESLGLSVEPVERFELVGTLNDHPGHLRSDQAKAPFPAIFALAVTSRTTFGELRSTSHAVAVDALVRWAEIYRPSGNPIDEWFFVPLLQSVDLVAPVLAPQDRALLLAWVQEFAAAGDRFFEGRAPRNPGLANNWTARRLLVRSVAVTVVGDATARDAMTNMVRGFVARNYVAGPAGERDGRTFDFEQRDALHYHIAAVQPLVEMDLYTPDLIDADARAAVLSGLLFLRPYFVGDRRHVEFARTTNSFDRQRAAAGNPVFRGAWDPDHGRVVLRLARAHFPEVRDWTEDIVDHRYDPRTELLAAIYGEPQRRSAWPPP
jgi:hypothetical protein